MNLEQIENCTEVNRWRWYWRQCNDDGDCDAVQNAVDDVDNEKTWKDKTFKDTQYKMQQTKNIGKK